MRCGGIDTHFPRPSITCAAAGTRTFAATNIGDAGADDYRLICWTTPLPVSMNATRCSGIFIKTNFLQDITGSPDSHSRIDMHRMFAGAGVRF